MLPEEADSGLHAILSEDFGDQLFETVAYHQPDLLRSEGRQAEVPASMVEARRDGGVGIYKGAIEVEY
jgi:hypothetical protein